MVLSTESIAQGDKLFDSVKYIMPEKPAQRRDPGNEAERAKAQRLLQQVEEQHDKSVSDIARITKRQHLSAERLLREKDQLSIESRKHQQRKCEAEKRASELAQKAQAEKESSLESQKRLDHTHRKITSVVERVKSVREITPVLTAPLRKKKARLQEDMEKLTSTIRDLDRPSSNRQHELQFIELPNPLEMTSEPELARSLLKSDVLDDFSIPVEPLTNLIAAYLSLPPPQRRLFADPEQCSAFALWASIRVSDGVRPLKRAPPRQDRDEDSEEETIAGSSPPKKARLSFTATPRRGDDDEPEDGDCSTAPMTPEVRDLLQQLTRESEFETDFIRYINPDKLGLLATAAAAAQMQ